MSGRRLAVALALGALAAASCGGGGDGRPGAAEVVRFGFFGDTPYSGQEAQAAVTLLDQMNDASLDLAIFVGDIFGSPCDNVAYTQAVDLFDTYRGALVYLPGDNEWTDCHPTRKDPIERLAHIRRTMFATDRSFGRRPITVEQQRPDYPENGRWRLGSILFVSLNVAGSNNNHIADPEAEEESTPRGPDDRRAAEAEYLARDAANRAWLDQSFEVATREGAPAVVVGIHADPGFGVPAAERATRRVDGFDRFLAALADEAVAYGKPVVLIHGDSHRFVHDRPLLDRAGQPVANVTRVETFGSPDVGWVEVVIDPANPGDLRVEPHLVLGQPR